MRVFSRQCWEVAPNSCCYQKHPGDAGHPGTAPFHRSSQASVGRSSSTRRCNPQGHQAQPLLAGKSPQHLHITPQIHLPYKTRSPPPLEGHTSPSTTVYTAPLAARRSLPQARASAAACLAERCGDVCTSANAAWQEAGQESWGRLHQIRWGWDTSTEQTPQCVTAPVLQHYDPALHGTVSAGGMVQHQHSLL